MSEHHMKTLYEYHNNHNRTSLLNEESLTLVHPGSAVNGMRRGVSLRGISQSGDNRLKQ